MEGRIRDLLVSCEKFGRDVSCLVEEFFAPSGFDPGAEADDRFGVFTEPTGGVAFDSQVDDSTDRTLYGSAADGEPVEC